MKIPSVFNSLTIKQRFTIPIITSVIIIMSFYGGIWALSTIRHNDRDLAAKINTTSELASLSLSDSLWNFDYDGVDSIINGLFNDTEIGMVSVDPNHDNDVFTRQKDGPVYEQLIFKTLPILHDSTLIGEVTVGITPHFRSQTLYRALWSFAQGIMLMVVFIWLTISYVSNAVTKPIMDLAAGTEEIAGGNLSKRLNAAIGGEVGELASKFNEMTEQLSISMQEREHTLSELAASEEKFNKAFHHVADAIGIINLNTQIYIEVNDAFSSVLGYGKHTVIGHSSAEFGLWYSEVERDEAYRLLQTVGAFNNFETRWRSASGEILTGMCSADVIEIGSEKCILFVWFDITERKKAEEMLQHINDELENKVAQRTSELSAMNIQLTGMYNELQTAHKQVIQQEKMASIGQLAAGVAHEINNPLGFIISNIESMRSYMDKIRAYISKLEDALDKITQLKQQEAGTIDISQVASEIAQAKQSTKIEYVIEDISDLLSETTEGAHRVKTIVQDLKTFSRTVVQATETDINKNIQSVINILWNEIKYKITLEKDLGELPLIWCNPNEINQVFMNLLHNAAQAIENEGVILIKTWAENGYVHIAISDTGSGMTEQIQTRIFEPFFTTKDVGLGTGLGLSITYEIIKNHNGSISVTSSPGKGTTFDVKLPITVQI